MLRSSASSDEEAAEALPRHKEREGADAEADELGHGNRSAAGQDRDDGSADVAEVAEDGADDEDSSRLEQESRVVLGVVELGLGSGLVRILVLP